MPGFRRLQDEVVVAVRLTESVPDVSGAGQLAAERENYLGFRWWPVAEIEASTERFYPGLLPALVRRFLEGEQIEEPFEFFSRTGMPQPVVHGADTGPNRSQYGTSVGGLRW